MALPTRTPLSSEEERRLIAEAQNGNKQAADRLYLYHKNWLNKQAALFLRSTKRPFNKDVLDDFSAAASLGFIEAIMRFDFTYENRLSTHSLAWVTMRMRHADMENWAQIGFKTSKQRQDAMKIKAHMKKQGLNVQNISPQGIEALCKELGIRKDTFEGAMAVLNNSYVSLNQGVIAGDESSGTLADFIEDDAPTPETAVLYKKNKEFWHLKLKDAMSALDARSITIVMQRFEGATLEDLGQQYGITRERVRQLQENALKKLRTRLLQDNAVRQAVREGQFDISSLDELLTP